MCAAPQTDLRATSVGWTLSTPSPLATIGIAATRTTGCCWSTTTTSSLPAPGFRPTRTGHGDSHLGDGRHARAPGLHRPQRRDLPRRLAQRMSAGRGILHSEKNDSLRQGGDHRDPVHFVQMWVVPDENNLTPGYEQLEIEQDRLAGGLVPVAPGMDKHDGEAAIRINNRHAALYAERRWTGRVSSTAQR